MGGFGTAEAEKEFVDLLTQVKQAQASLDEKNEALVRLGVELHSLRAEADKEKQGESAYQHDQQVLEEELEYVESQIAFYTDGVEAVSKLYSICTDSLTKVEEDYASKRLEASKKNANSDTNATRRRLAEKELEDVKSEYEAVMKEWHQADGDVKLMIEKQRNKLNKYFGTIENDYHAQREWRKFKYFTQMITTLKQHLRDSSVQFQDYKPERLYAAILRHKVPLEKWVEFSKAQLLRSEAEEDGSPMELDQEAGQVHEMLKFLAARGRAVEQQTWPDMQV